jgi:hemerythrin-like metal-binding protein
MYFELQQKYFTGIDKIDNQHLKIVELMNKLYDDIILKANDKNVDESIIDLKLYAIFHFSTEENLFKKHHYTGAECEDHLKKHEEFSDKIAQFLSDSSSTKIEIGYRLLEYLKAWLTAHILSTDMIFANHLKKIGITRVTDNDIVFDEDDQ